jgi:hypothetical protein
MTKFSALLVALLFGALSGSAAPAHDGAVTFASGAPRAALLELYTSEGCSSCPPAEAWLSRLEDDPRLWREVVPVAFHVDYWDNLGWKDPFASPAFTARQRGYAARWNSESVYTPGFVLNGKEWRFGGSELALTPAEKKAAGVLSVELQKNRSAMVVFHPAKQTDAAREIHLTLLGCGLRQAVGAGENSGRTLTHDFVSLGVAQGPMLADNGSGALRATISLPAPPAAAQAPSTRLAVAAWVSAAGELEPEQATGGWLP